MFTHHNRSSAAEDYRDDMICLAIETLLAYEEDGSFDDESLVIVCNALHDIRVRDVLVLELLSLPRPRLLNAYDCLDAAVRLTPCKFQAPALTLMGIIAWASGAPQHAHNLSAYALHHDQDYSLAKLLYLATGHALPFDSFRDSMLADVSYEAARGI